MAPTALPAAPHARPDRRPLVALALAIVVAALLCLRFSAARWVCGVLLLLALLRSLGAVLAARASMRDPDAPRPAPPEKNVS